MLPNTTTAQLCGILHWCSALYAISVSRVVIELLNSSPCAIFTTQHSPCTVSITQTGGSALSNTYGIERNK